MKILSKLNLLFTLSFLFLSSQLFAQINGSSNVCAGQVETYTSVTSASTYNWVVTGAASFTPNGSTVTVEWGIGGGGSIALTTFNQNNISTGSFSLSVGVNSSPNPVFASGFSTNCLYTGDGQPDSCFTACQYRPTVYTAAVNAGFNYSWKVIGAGTMTTISANQVEVVWNTLGVHYLELTVSNAAGCSNTYEKCIKVLESPTAVIGTTPTNSTTIAVCKDADIFLQDLSTGSTGRRWDFGDGSFSDLLNPTHRYSQAGVYQVILTANNDCYCLNSDTITVTVQNTEAPEIICPAVVCGGDTVSYSTPASCSSFTWSAINGTIIGSSTNSSVEVVWNTHVGYIQLEGVNCNNSCNAPALEKVAVLVDSIPIQGANPACIGDSVIYSIPPIPGSVYTWTVPTSVGKIIEDNGYYIKVKINGTGYLGVNYTNPLLGCSGTSDIFISAKDKLSYSFPNEVCRNDSGLFTIVDSVSWTITDTSGVAVFANSGSTEVSFTWNQFNSGDYTLTLGKLNSYCNDLQLPFTILPAPVAPDTIVGANSICGSDAYNYSVQPKSGYTVEWLIQGGNPAIAVGNSVTVNWGSPPYILQAAYRQLNSPNCLSDYRVKTLASATNGTPTILGQNGACGGDTMSLNLNFVADDVKWRVIPANGASIITDRFQSKITIKTDASTTQTITLEAEGSICGTNFLLTKTVGIQSFPVPTISFTDPNPCPKVAVRLSSSVLNPQWLINGVVNSSSNPTISYDSAQSVTVQLTASYTGPNGCTVDRVNVQQLVVKNAPKANIAVLDSNLNHCSDTLNPIVLTASLQGQSQANYTYNWSKNSIPLGVSGNSYTTPAVGAHGVYSVVITAPNGCESLPDDFPIDSCSGGGNCFSITANNPDTIDIVLNSIDCSNYEVAQVTVVGVPSAVLLSIVNKSDHVKSNSNGPLGLGVELNAGINSIQFFGYVLIGVDTFCFTKIVTQEVPVITSFEVVKQSCSNSGFEQFKFINTSTYSGAVPPFTWNFGGGSMVPNGNTFDPIVEFPTGTYTVSLSASGTSCTSTTSKQVAATTVPTNASFISSGATCQQELVHFTNLSTGNIIEHRWDFGGNELFETSPSLTFVDGNNNFQANFFRNIELTILSANGCRDTTMQQVSIRGNQFTGQVQPLLPPEICSGDSILLDFSQGNLINTPVQYQWSTQESTSSIEAKQTGNYKLSLTDNVGCRFVSKQVNVQVNQSPNPQIMGKQTFCEYEEVQLSTYAHPSLNINWEVNNAPVAFGKSKISQDLTPGNHIVIIKATNTSNGCPSVNAPFPVTVLAGIPKPIISASSSYPLCEGSPIQLSASPAGANFYWSTGQSGSSITQTLAGRYTVYQNDISGCVSSESIDINPLPDFSNLMTGCYCIPFGNTPDILGIPNMLSYQWVKDGVNVPAPNGQLQNLPASNGSFELIASTDSGCVDTGGIIDITVGGCKPCILSLSDFKIECSQTIDDSTFYTFSLVADIDNNAAAYSLHQAFTINGQPATANQLQPSSIIGSGNNVTGVFGIRNAQLGDSICVQLTASNPAVNCTASLCTVIEPLACNFVPVIAYTINPYTCVAQFSSNSLFNSCIATDSVSYNWTITQSEVYTSTDDSFILTELETGQAQVCLQMQVFNASDSSYCVKDTCITIVVPDCSCKDDCSSVGLAAANFNRFIQRNDSCITEFKMVLNNPQNIFVFPNHFQTGTGKILSIAPTTAAPNTTAYLVQYYPEQPAQCGEVCFELFLNAGGTDCCLNVCVNLPTCSCNLELEDLSIECSGDPDQSALYDFSFTTNFAACDGFNYAINELSALLDQVNVDVIAFTPNSLSNGTTIVSGQVDLGAAKGETICFTVGASLAGVNCSNTICITVPETECETEVSFSSDFDPSACALRLNSESNFSACSRLIDSQPYVWTLSYDGIIQTQYGQTVDFYGISDKTVDVCLTVKTTDITGTVCEVTYCETISVEECQCEEECEEIEVVSTNFVSYSASLDSCILIFDVTIANNSNAPISLTSILSDVGTVLNFTLMPTQNGTSTYRVQFYPNEPWEGDKACFNAYIELEDGSTCCVAFCATLPSCECDVQLNELFIDCSTAPHGTPGDFSFSLEATIVGTNATLTSATLGGIPVQLNTVLPTALQSGLNNITGLFSASQAAPSDLFCITIESNIGGNICTETICTALPDNSCSVTPNFTYALNSACELVITNASTIGQCTYVDTSAIIWWIDAQPIFINDTGNSVIIPDSVTLSGERVCITITGTNWTQDSTCTPRTFCADAIYVPCPTPPLEPVSGNEEGRRERKKVIEVQSGFKTYPNPAQNLIWMEWEYDLDETIEIRLLNQNGKVLLKESRQVNGNKTKLNLNNYSEGVYVLEVQKGDETFREKIVLLK